MKLINIIPIFLFLHCTHATFLPKDDAPDLPRDVKDISPENRIKWTPCDLHSLRDEESNEELNVIRSMHMTLECGKLTVPLDYTLKHSTDTTTLNLFKVKASGTSTEKAPKGSIIVNPGGPGVSGFDKIDSHGHIIMSFFDGQYDIISFDPRGTGKTLVPPDSEVFPVQMFEQIFDARRNSSDLLNKQSLRDAWGYMSTTTERFLTNDTDFRRFRGTAFVARDIAEIATALGEGNRINYWGISYGTVLGQVLAGMFPERIERMLLEGNLLADDYVKNLGQDGIQDAEKALYHFYDVCMTAPNGKCLSATKLPKKRDEFLKFLDRVFMVCTGDGGGLRRFKSLPLNMWLFEFLHESEDYHSIDKLINTALEGDRSVCPKGNPFGDGAASQSNPPFPLVNLAIWCSDATFRAESVEEFRSYFNLYKGRKAVDNPFFLTTLFPRSVCSRWSINAAEPINLRSLSKVKTKNPILLVNGEYDPVTPLSHARKISARFPGSQVVVHRGAGHGAVLGAQDSNCTQQIVKNYFIKGVLPSRETTCEPDVSIFGGVDVHLGKGKARKHTTPVFVWVVLGLLGFVCLGLVFLMCKRK